LYIVSIPEKIGTAKMTKINKGLLEPGPSFQFLAGAIDLPIYFAQAACVGLAPRVFDGETLEDILTAKKTCGECPIQALCRDWASKTQEYGVWGGLTPLERKKYAKSSRTIDIGEIRMLESNRGRLLSSTPASKLAAEFDVTERTIYRWRKKIQELKQAS
jgi:hypothetical protein